jgi:replicative superfamily II helicase
MIDEVHLLGDETRGHSLEAIITRSKSIQRAARHVNATQRQIDVSR